MKSKYGLIFSVMMIFLYACGGGDGSGGTDDDDGIPMGGDDDNPPVEAPNASTLIFPANNEECNEGTVISETESDVNFRWNASEHTDSYSVTLVNLTDQSSTNVIEQGTERVFRLKRGAPYEWSVVSRSNSTTETASSEKWRFFNEGPGIENYAPFPAEAIYPPRGSSLDATTNVRLEWSTSDVDDDLKEFEVFLGTTEDNMTSLGVFEDMQINSVSVTSATQYHWSVKTTDNNGNSSTSEVFQFRIN